MTTTDRKIFSFAVITLAIVAVLGCSILYLMHALDDADRSSADTAMTRVLAQRIESKRPAGVKNTAAGLAEQLPKLLDAAMKTAEIDAENLDRISPQPARQSHESEMTEIPLQLNFQQISLRQLITFVTSLTDENAWLTVRDLHLTHLAASPTEGTTAGWNVEMTVSYLTQSSATGTAVAN